MSDIVDIKLTPVKGTKRSLYKLVVVANAFASEKKYIRFIKANNGQLSDSKIDLINRMTQADWIDIKYLMNELTEEEEPEESEEA